MQRFLPDAMVTAAVTFSRCLYAQLVQQAVQAPAGFSTDSQQPPAFTPSDGFPLPPPDDPSLKAALLGMKLTAGMEIMCSAKARAERGGESSVSPVVRSATVYCHIVKPLPFVHVHRRADAWLHESHPLLS